MSTDTITVTQHERDEWSRMAQDAYRTGRNFFGHRYSVAAATAKVLDISVYDALQINYRRWLVFGWRGVENPE